jgi:hypothetical protein
VKIKWCFTLLIVLLITLAPVTSASAPLKLFVNNQPVTWIGLPAVKVIDNTLYVDIHAISNELKLDVDSDHKNNSIYISNISEPQSEIVATYKKAKATLYATKREGNLEKFRLEIDRETRWFPYWRNSDTPAFGPRFFHEDINQDGKKELVIILTTGHGTGVLITEAHVLQKTQTNIGEIYMEKLIDNPLAIINKNVKTKKLLNDQVEIGIGKKKTIDNIYKYLGGEHIEFSVYNNELVAFISGQVSPPPEGAILITYQFKDNMYQAKKIEYVKNRPDFIMESSFQ